jgi:hypothetical protein
MQYTASCAHYPVFLVLLFVLALLRPLVTSLLLVLITTTATTAATITAVYGNKQHRGGAGDQAVVHSAAAFTPVQPKQRVPRPGAVVVAVNGHPCDAVGYSGTRK